MAIREHPFIRFLRVAGPIEAIHVVFEAVKALSRCQISLQQLTRVHPALFQLMSRGWVLDSITVRKGDLRFHIDDCLYNVYGTFEVEEYALEDSLIGKTVFDVGANIGDTAIYFARRGARVVAFEPLPEVYRRALVNVHLNGFDSGVVIHNVAIGAKEDIIRINERSIKLHSSGGFSVHASSREESSRGTAVRVARLSSFLEGEDPYLLKLDCEGSEYDIILEDYSSVRQFHVVFAEWHEGETGIPVSKLVDKLREDFDVSLVYGVGDSRGAANAHEATGMLLARRRAGVL